MKKYIRSIIYFILFAFLITTFVYLGKKDFKNNNLPDNERFAIEYNITNNNHFKYVFGSQALDVIKNKTGIVYIGFSSNDWSRYYIKYLNEVLNENNIKQVYYYNLQKDRVKNTKYYRELESILSDYLYELDTGVVRLSTPALVFVKNGKIVYFDDETSIERNNMTPDYYWTQDRIESFKGKIDKYLKEVDFNE